MQKRIDNASSPRVVPEYTSFSGLIRMLEFERPDTMNAP